jgi:4-amino-4-deoxy-L-arabinose transferase-like glycosyltransferase
MYARNFLEIDNNILLARVDMAGELSGITAKEFPIFNYLIYLVSFIAGWQHWYGRLINLVVSSFGTYYFYLILKRFFTERHAFSATIVLLGSIWFSYSRKIMPDTFSMSLVIIGLYYGLNYILYGKPVHVLLYFLFGTLGVLSKIPSIFACVILVLPIFDKRIRASRKIWFILASVLLLGINALWYLYWVPTVIDNYGFVHYPEREFMEGASQLFKDIRGMLANFYWNAFLSFISLAVFLGGLVLLIIRKERRKLLVFLLLFLSFFIFMLKAGSSFTRHNYYIIPFVPAMAFVSGYFFEQLRWRWLITVLFLLIVGESIANQQHEFYNPAREEYKLELESIADSVSHPQDLVAFSGGHNPQQLYFSHRKGWALNDEEIDTVSEVEAIRDRGAKYLFINKATLGTEFTDYPIVYENNHYRVYDLR